MPIATAFAAGPRGQYGGHLLNPHLSSFREEKKGEGGEGGDCVGRDYSEFLICILCLCVTAGRRYFAPACGRSTGEEDICM